MKKAYTNNTEKFKHIGGKMIPPGETRTVDSADLPSTDESSESEIAPVESPWMEQIKALNVKQASESLVDLSNDQLDQLESVEERSGVLKALQKLRIDRAKDLQQFIADMADTGIDEVMIAWGGFSQSMDPVEVEKTHVIEQAFAERLKLENDESLADLIVLAESGDFQLLGDLINAEVQSRQ